MRRLLGLFVAFIGLSVVAYSQPKLEMYPPNEYNWGKVKSTDNPLKATVKIYNHGNEELHIVNVKPGCGCTTAPLDKKILPPGDSANLDITLNITGYSDNVVKSIMIESTDPEKKSFYYYIKANVFRPIVVVPQYIPFNELYYMQEASSKVMLKNNTDAPIKILDIKTNPESLKINLKANDVLKPKSETPLEVKFTPTQIGVNSIRVSITTDNEESKTIDINGWGSAIDPKQNKN
ncbi:MAG TPA: DUF1573 domain-containing protein [Candidatus Kapabacteria bacterium]|jgi:hypothetical protein|nr:DUF1573 domain-containing protein [Candidatus Kapabacteria bacterium]HOM04987.1 DUF1573 domain-containing protein [Candidatus Kapabacteria bacterium]HPP40216.1 DUF1573 domain-containing protein [Candidatus Kapabacteria bacterium]